MKSRLKAMADFFNEPTNNNLRELQDVLHFYVVRGTMSKPDADKILRNARSFLDETEYPEDE